jgi:NhaP-type Na+/H+ or K+/H+ antiporter
MNPGTQAFVIAICGGVLAQATARLLRLPAIIPLLGYGILMGPQALGWMGRPDEIFGDALYPMISMGVVIILFEGGMQLSMEDLRLAPNVVRNLVTLGAVLSFIGAGAAAYFVAGMSIDVSLLYGALMIVTGPTVINPLLKNVRVVRRVHTVLIWEGILIDAVGAIVAVITLEFVLQRVQIMNIGASFFGGLVIGPLIGAVGGWLLAQLLMWRKRKGLFDEELDQVLALAGAVGLFGFSEYIFHEAGLGAVIASGLVIANVMRREVEDIRRFKGVLTTVLISVVFMLLAANFDLRALRTLWPWGFIAIGALMFVVRPLSVMLCTRGTKLSYRERIFIGLIGPRGIIAASIASLFGIILRQNNHAEAAEALVAITFCTIVVTVIINGLMAAPLATALGLRARPGDGLLIIGANELALRMAAIYENHGHTTVLVDMNPDLCDRARGLGFRVIQGDALDCEWLLEHDLSSAGNLLALTSSSAVNARACSYNVRELNMERGFSVVSRTTMPHEIEMIKNANASVAFSAWIDPAVIFREIRGGRTALKRYTDKAAIQKAERPFLPLVVQTSEGMRPYVAGEEIPKAGSLIGIEMLLPVGEAPFALAFAP